MLDLYAITFFALVKAAFKADSKEKIDLIQITRSPQTEDGGQKLIEYYTSIYEGFDPPDPKIINRDRERLKKLSKTLL